MTPERTYLIFNAIRLTIEEQQKSGNRFGQRAFVRYACQYGRQWNVTEEEVERILQLGLADIAGQPFQSNIKTLQLVLWMIANKAGGEIRLGDMDFPGSLNWQLVETTDPETQEKVFRARIIPHHCPPDMPPCPECQEKQDEEDEREYGNQ